MDRKSTVTSRQHVIAFAAMLGLLVGGIAKAEAASYTFTKIADTATAGDFSQFCGPPALNDKGVVAFSARLDAGPSGIFTGDRTSPRTIAESSVPCSVFGPPSLSGSGVLAFRFSLGFGQDVIIRTDGSTPTTIAEIGSRGFRTFLGNPSINDSDTVAFFGFDGSGSGIFTSDGTTPTAIAHTPSPFRTFGENPSLADGGVVAFLASDAAGSGIFRSDGTTPPTTIAHTSGPYFSLGFFPSRNNEGAVAFWATLDTFVSGIFVSVSDATTPTTIADSRGPFLAFDAPSINDKGVVAFWARLDAGGSGIFTGPDPGAHKVIATGDALDGSTVTFLTFGREGLNNAGAVAFVATLADATRVVYRADPVPSELKVSIDIKPGGNPNSINLKSQGTVPVAILTTADFDATTVDPTTVALAGAPVKLKKNGMLMYAYEDANGDGRVDLVVHVSTQDLQLDESSPVAVLTGKTFGKVDIITGKTLGEVPITGADTVRVVP